VKVVLAILILPALLAQAEPLADILARMDHAAQDFRALSANMKRVQFTAVISEANEMEGVVRLKRLKGSTVGIVDFQHPEQRTVYINGHNVQIYYPKANTVEIYDSSKYTSNIDQFLLLGFGTSSAELQKSYDLKMAGTETIGGGATTRIEMTPKSAELKKLITKIELWIPEGQDTAIQEKVTEPSKNYELITYSEVKVNPSLPDSSFELKLPAKVKKIHPQK
jgi:outer membrane lipoprotein-sorting protein